MQVFVFVVLTAVTYGIIEGPGLPCFLIAAVALAALLVYEPRRPEPLIDLRFFRSVPFSGATLIGAAVSGSTAAGYAQAGHAGWWIIVGLGAAVLALGLVTTAPAFAATKEKAVVNAWPRRGNM